MRTGFAADDRDLEAIGGPIAARDRFAFTHRASRSAGTISVTSANCGRPDIAAKSLKVRTIAFQPTAAGFSLGRKCTPLDHAIGFQQKQLAFAPARPRPRSRRPDRR